MEKRSWRFWLRSISVMNPLLRLIEREWMAVSERARCDHTMEKPLLIIHVTLPYKPIAQQCIIRRTPFSM